MREMPREGPGEMRAMLRTGLRPAGLLLAAWLLTGLAALRAPAGEASPTPEPEPKPVPGDEVRLVLRGGKTVEGVLVESGIFAVIVEREEGPITFPPADVERIEPLKRTTPGGSGETDGTDGADGADGEWDETADEEEPFPEPTTPTPSVDATLLWDLQIQYDETEVSERRRELYAEIAAVGGRTIGLWLVEQWEDVEPETITGSDSCVRALGESGAREALIKLRSFLDDEKATCSMKTGLVVLYCKSVPYAPEVRLWKSMLIASTEGVSDLPPEERAREVYEQFPEALRWHAEEPRWSDVARMLRAVIGTAGERSRDFISPSYR